MTLIDLSPRIRRVTESDRINAVITEYGVLRVLRATLIAAIRKRPRRVARAFTDDLPDYIRRDIGVDPRVHPPSYLRHHF